MNPKPPQSPPSKNLEGRDVGKPGVGSESHDAAEQEELARKESKGRPPGAKR